MQPGADGGFEAPLWRALAVFRIAALVYALILILHNDAGYAHPIAAWLVGGAMTIWTLVAVRLYSRPAAQRWPLLVADLVIMGGCLLVSVPIIGIGPLPATRSLPGIAVAGPVLACAISSGRRAGAVAAIIVGAADLWTRGIVNQNTLNSDILLLLAAVAIGHVARLGAAAHAQLARATEIEAATRTRERLARDIHDSVLQVLTLVARRAQSLGGEAAELGRLAGEQEAALRALVGTTAIGPSGVSATASAGDGVGRVDVRPLLERLASASVTIAAPAGPVMLPRGVTDELVAAIGAALDNVDRHAGPSAHAWVLLEDDSAMVTVTVRDDGVGMSPGHVDRAAAAGRLGVAQSIRGRLRDIGGSAQITSAPGEGTEVELRWPRSADVARVARPREEAS